MFCPKCGKEVSEGAQFCQHCGADLQVAEPGVKPKRSPLVIVLIIVGVIFGFIILSIIAAITIPRLLSAKQRSNQLQTMKDMRSISTALVTYWVDFDIYPICNDIDELAELLQPNYMRMVPKLDGWGNPFKYGFNKEGNKFYIMSFGRDGVQDKFEPFPEYVVVISSFDEDIVLCDGQFIFSPVGPGTD